MKSGLYADTETYHILISWLNQSASAANGRYSQNSALMLNQEKSMKSYKNNVKLPIFNSLFSGP